MRGGKIKNTPSTKKTLKNICTIQIYFLPLQRGKYNNSVLLN
nr:MAG TPA: hypothetical protein [Ackermannviridae sp.]